MGGRGVVRTWSDYSRLRAWAHRTGIARTVARVFPHYGPPAEARVETALPSARLALYAAGMGPMRVIHADRLGRLRRCYRLRAVKR